MIIEIFQKLLYNLNKMRNLCHKRFILIVYKDEDIQGGDGLDIDWTDIGSIINNYYESLYRYCYKMMRNKEDAEDIVQEVFISINNLLESKKNIKLHNNYLYKMAYNQCVDNIRRSKIIKFISFEKSGMEDLQYKKDIYFEDELSEELTKIMFSLNGEERSLLILKAIEDMNYDEISKIMGKTVASLRKQYERTRKKVMKAFKEEVFIDVKN